MSRRRSSLAWVVLVLSGVIAVGTVIERAATGSLPEYHDLGPFVMAAFVARELLKQRGRRRAARAAAVTGSVLIAVMALWAGGSALWELTHGDGTDWLGLAVGVLGAALAFAGIAAWRESRTNSAHPLTHP
ncbi:hypothetical protein OG230_11520 [Streptomyces sp. NBC_00234]|uniref:hypothetical protein n=1 Tax=Streptomyces sp. NBC_00234 TaxID=2903638 RepID=UPI002E289569|nr:hypothetical protein [Streptomyces sp. NBC_00234]